MSEQLKDVPVLEPIQELDIPSSPNATSQIKIVDIIDHSLGLDVDQLEVVGVAGQVQVLYKINDVMQQTFFVDTIAEAEDIKLNLLSAE